MALGDPHSTRSDTSPRWATKAAEPMPGIAIPAAKSCDSAHRCPAAERPGRARPNVRSSAGEQDRQGIAAGKHPVSHRGGLHFVNAYLAGETDLRQAQFPKPDRHLQIYSPPDTPSWITKSPG